MVKDDVESRTEKVHEESRSAADKIHAEHAEFSWDEAAKSSRKVKKNLLLVEASTKEKKATCMKVEASQAVSGTQIYNPRFTNGDSIIMNFDNENTRGEAAKKFEYVEQISTRSVGKMEPKTAPTIATSKAHYDRHLGISD